MFVQILIYVYLGICAGMILFNIVTALLSQRREHRPFRDGIRLELTVERELDHLALTGEVNEEHLRYMERRLRRVNGLAAFDAALEHLCVRRPELTRSYLTALNGVMIALAEDYCRREEIEAAYFPYIIKKYRLLGGADDAPLKEVLLELLHEPSIYCRENAMQALYTAGDPAVLVRALRIIDASSLYYHSKLLSDGLLNYTGDTWELADALWEAFDAFQPWMQVTLLNYFRFSPAHTARKYTRSSTTARGTTRCAFPACATSDTTPIPPPTPICCAMRRPRKTRAGSMQPSPRRCWRAIPGRRLRRCWRGTSIIPTGISASTRQKVWSSSASATAI